MHMDDVTGGQQWAWRILLLDSSYLRMRFHKRGFNMRVDEVAGNTKP